MIKDKITPEIKNKFLKSINLTKNTGNEHGFYLCSNNNELSTSKTKSGGTHEVTIGNPSHACRGKKIQGDFHTHAYLTLFKNTSKFMKPGMTDNDARKFINNEFNKYKKELGIEELTIDSPSSKDLLKSILYKCTNISKGTTCTGSDFGNDKVECWTTKNLSIKNCSDTYSKLFENGKNSQSTGINSQSTDSQSTDSQSTGIVKERDLVKYDKETISLFDKETINLK